MSHNGIRALVGAAIVGALFWWVVFTAIRQGFIR